MSMAGSPQWKVYDPQGKYQAACKEAEAAAALMAFYGNGAKVKQDHGFTVWTEGVDGEAGESFDDAAQQMEVNFRAAIRAKYLKEYGPERYEAMLARFRPSRS